MVDLRMERLSEEDRAEAVDRAWAQMLEGTQDRYRVREEFKKDLFLMSTGDRVRLRIVEKLLSDTDPAGLADTQNVLRLRLPTERSWGIIELVSRESAERGWVEMTPSLVRSYARKLRDMPDEERPERAALLRLHPGKSIEQVVYDVFVGQATARVGTEEAAPKATAPGAKAPLTLGATRSGRSILDEKIQSDAWELLGRLDKDGSRRAALLAGDARLTGQEGQDPVLADLRAAAKDLRAVPVTGPELDWVKGLRERGNTVNAAWWGAAAEALARLGDAQAAGLEIRHAEVVRWAAANRPEWLGRSKDELRAELASRLKDRRVYFRSAERSDVTRTPYESLEEWAPSLVWADYLTMLVIDDAVRDPSVRAAIFDQANEDRANKLTEYGGALEAAWPGGDPRRAVESGGAEAGFVARLFLPVVPARVMAQDSGDARFVASEQMMASTPRAVAHYHFHVQNTSNEKFAGPSKGDLDYAASQARNCVVFTSIKDGVLDVDYYQRNGARIDLGELRR